MKRRTKIKLGAIISGLAIGFLSMFALLSGFFLTSSQVILGWLLGLLSFPIAEYWRESRENSKKNRQFITTMKKIGIETNYTLNHTRENINIYNVYDDYKNHLAELSVELKKNLVEVDDNYIIKNVSKVTDIIDIMGKIRYYDVKAKDFDEQLTKLISKTLKFIDGYRER